MLSSTCAAPADLVDNTVQVCGGDRGTLGCGPQEHIAVTQAFSGVTPRVCGNLDPASSDTAVALRVLQKQCNNKAICTYDVERGSPSRKFLEASWSCRAGGKFASCINAGCCFCAD